ncbi:MAG: aldo/keto reductase [Oscillospiraceae bacterium]|nr:aldo/keto reductase [Oscillospiraceae bacterium]
MIFRELGNTGRSVSVIGLGCEHLDRKPYEQVKETIDAALSHGVNIMDVFMPGTPVREHIAKALGSRRGDVYIQGHIGATDVNQQYDISRDMPTVKKYFEKLLRIFGGYIDFGMMFFIDSEDDYKNVFETEFADYVQKLKKDGDIRHIGFSSHNPLTAIKAIETGLPEMMMFSINLPFDMLPPETYVFDHFDDGFGADLFRGIDPNRARLYKLCAQKQIGITVMKTLGAGKLLNAKQSPFASPMTVPQCIEYALTRPAVAAALPGCKTAEEVRGVMAYFTCTEEERDYSHVLSAARNDFRGNCLYCSHCQPCPAGIDIAAVMKCLDVAALDEGNIPASVRSLYSSMQKCGADCVRCGSCESRCPFGVQIMDSMEKAVKLL